MITKFSYLTDEALIRTWLEVSEKVKSIPKEPQRKVWLLELVELRDELSSRSLVVLQEVW